VTGQTDCQPHRQRSARQHQATWLVGKCGSIIASHSLVVSESLTNPLTQKGIEVDAPGALNAVGHIGINMVKPG
jgi:hypothetical protein